MAKRAGVGEREGMRVGGAVSSVRVRAARALERDGRHGLLARVPQLFRQRRVLSAQRAARAVDALRVQVLLPLSLRKRSRRRG
eukprot:3412911-Pleurochrysis_carterae.AAC.5